MGPKQSREKINRHDSLKNNNNNIFSDAVDLEVEAEEIKLGNKKSMFCAKCNCIFKTTNKNEIENWIKHKKKCKGVTNQINNNNLNPKPPNIIPPPPRIVRPPPININTNNYNSNIPYRPQSTRHNYRPQNSQVNINNPVIRVNQNNQELNNILNAIGLETKKVLPRGKKDGTFEEKVDYLRFDISKKKIDFINGAEKLKINRDKVLEDSMEQFNSINLFKELKIIFVGEESHDAGGLIREWLTILFQKILDSNTGLFQRSDTDEIGFIIKPNLYPSQELLNKYFFIGRVLAKALLENLTVNCCFNKVIYQLILGEKIELNDLV